MVLTLRAVSAKVGQDRRDCCGRACEYAVDRVRWHLNRIIAYQRAGEELDLRYASQQLDRYGGTPNDGSTTSIDIGRTVDQLLAEGTPVTAETVAARLCPWSGEGEARS